MESRLHWQENQSGIMLPSIEGRLLCSSRDPQREAKTWWNEKKHEMAPLSAMVVLGLGAGFHIREILETAERPAVIFVVEKETEIMLRWQKSNLDLAAQVQFLPVGDELELRPPSDVGILEFRPAWTGNEKFYSAISQSLHGMTIHQIVANLHHEDQSKEAKIWRALKEFVA